MSATSFGYLLSQMIVNNSNSPSGLSILPIWALLGVNLLQDMGCGKLFLSNDFLQFAQLVEQENYLSNCRVSRPGMLVICLLL